jgi:hypothetical protein
MSRLLVIGIAVSCLAAGTARAQVAAGTYVGSVNFQNICSNNGQGSSSVPMRLTVASNGSLEYLETIIYSAGVNAGGQAISQGGYSVIKVAPSGNWSSQNLVYGGQYTGYSTQGGTWGQSFSTSGGVVSATGTFDVIQGGQVVCSEPTSAVFIKAPSGY